jgi:cystathionine beta-lyase/cystathionine gamma-synthase
MTTSTNDFSQVSAPKLYSSSTLAIHADDRLNKFTDVAPSLHVSTTFRYSSDVETLIPLADEETDLDNITHVYSRLSSPNTTRLETILSSLLDGYALTYSSGLSAFHALLVYFRPRVIAISGGYHGCHGVVAILQKLYGLRKVDLHDESAWEEAGLGPGDIVHVETPLNPTGEVINLLEFREKANKRGAYLTVDATFAPPPLQNPFDFGVDVVMHSGTKYLGGHSDMLCGVLAMKKREWWEGMWKERMYLGGVMGSLEGWLGVRSLRTLELRIMAQSRNAERLVGWMSSCLNSEEKSTEDEKVVSAAVYMLQHASLQKDDMDWIKKQMPNGFGPVFSVWMKEKELARRLPSKLRLFHHATSLGGVESLIEWRKMSDQGVDDRVVRISVGVENWEDLRDDLLQGFRSLLKELSTLNRVSVQPGSHLELPSAREAEI